MIAKEGYPIIGGTLIIVLALAAGAYFSGSLVLEILTWVFLALTFFHLYFFRDPVRPVPEGEKLIISPADGHVVKIEEVDEPLYFKEKVRKVSIFLSVFDVHVNRMPVAGEVDYVDYRPGKFLAAFADDASDHNEQSVIGVRSAHGRVLFKQIAGLIARRIIYYTNVGDKVRPGERMGLIRYGSRIDMFFPLDVTVKVKLKQRVRCGASVIGEFK
ncbi:MAG TPA: phosphatidylserine decarboxylase family protein [Caldithrix abyssi]|uniref:Phosphatidylserine decarboxylase proenzyme n=1 Tax=Caldithrix abyssi TaxID=187145 RepID=A0A7V5VF92_CALAY|nr:phosphatidylserine decarboxylase family protein [Caldithrix abyssi]